MKTFKYIFILIFLFNSSYAISSNDGAIAVLAASMFVVGQTNEDVSLVASGGYQHKRLKFEQRLRYPTNFGTDTDFEVDIPTFNLSVTAAFKKIFIALKYEASLTEGTTDADETPFGAETSYYYNIPDGVTEVEREDINLTIGYNIYKSFNIFAGYMAGETVITPAIGCQTPAFVTDCANPGAFVNYAWGQKFVGGSGAPNYEHVYEEQGPYIGASYAWQISDIGALSTSLAYAKMDGSYTDNFVNNADFEYTGESKGISFGLTWTAPLGENSNYFIDLRRQAYKMDAKDNNGNFPGGTAETIETMTGLTAGIQYYF